ncbi:uracil-DNA glycosylase [Propioniciclava soli]|uniref:Type-5 uracil-DNA glycosylase n=1 Tax=Propioniciclava soli TaxID=2775081 RepID=A0ABZ3C5Y5_9ACTN
MHPHPITGQPFGSPVPPGAGWPGDPADAATPVAHDAAGVAALAAAAASTQALDAAVSVCRACPRLVEWRESVAATKRAAYAGEPYWGRPAPSFGDPAASVLIVGLAPAAHGANRTGRMFTGDRSGDWLYAALHRAGFASQARATHTGDGMQLRGVRIAAAVHCAPPANQPTTAERATCGPWLDRELQLLEPQLRSILCLGSIGWDAALVALRRGGWEVPRPKPRFGHGAVAEVATPTGRGVRLVGSYHVSQQNTFTGRLTEAMLDAVFALV